MRYTEDPFSNGIKMILRVKTCRFCLANEFLIVMFTISHVCGFIFIKDSEKIMHDLCKMTDTAANICVYHANASLLGNDMNFA